MHQIQNQHANPLKPQIPSMLTAFSIQLEYSAGLGLYNAVTISRIVSLTPQCQLVSLLLLPPFNAVQPACAAGKCPEPLPRP
jgi:hypothetical protein